MFHAHVTRPKFTNMEPAKITVMGWKMEFPFQMADFQVLCQFSGGVFQQTSLEAKSKDERIVFQHMGGFGGFV